MEPLGGIGTSGSRYQGFELALGDKPYVDDLRVPGLLHGAVRLADHARADVVRIDTSAAEAVPGVVRVLTAADVPGELRVGLIHKDWPVFIPEGGRTSYLGDVLAFVVAGDRETARRAAALVEVEYRVLRTHHRCGRRPHRRRGRGVGARRQRALALGVRARRRRRSAGARARTWCTRCSRPSASSTRSSNRSRRSSCPSPAGRFTMYSGGQGVWDDRDQVASVLGIDPQRIVAELVSNGGAFGGKEDMANQAQTALAAFLLDAPVKCTLSREESLLHPPEAPPDPHRSHGRLRRRRPAHRAPRPHGRRLGSVRVGRDEGARARGGSRAAVRTASRRSTSRRSRSRTNNSVCGAFRGFGANQAQFAMEGALDRLAERVGISGWEIRQRNVIEPGEVWGPGQVMDDGCRGAQRCLEAVKPAYDAAVAAGPRGRRRARV